MLVAKLGAVWLSVFVAMAGCGEEELGTRERPGLVMVDGEPMVTCGDIRPGFAVSAMDNGVEGVADEAEVAAALDELRAEAGIDAPRELQKASAAQAEWKVLGGDPTDDPERLLVGVGHWSAATETTDGQYVVLERTEAGWRASAWGDCQLAPVLVEGASWAEIAAAPGGAVPGSSSIEVLVSETECTSSRDPGPYLHEPIVVERDDVVTIYWTSDTPTGAQDCPGNPRVRRTVHLDRPLGDRTVLDGSRWPPRPIRGL